MLIFKLEHHLHVHSIDKYIYIKKKNKLLRDKCKLFQTSDVVLVGSNDETQTRRKSTMLCL